MSCSRFIYATRLRRLAGADEFVCDLRSDDAVRDIPVIFLSSESDAGQAAKELGAVGYLLKPVRADTLLSLSPRACATA